MEVIGKYTGLALEHYLDQKEPQILKLKNFIRVKNFAFVLFCIFIAFNAVITFLFEYLHIEMNSAFKAICAFFVVIFIIIFLSANKYINQKTFPLITDFIGNIEPIKNNTDNIESLIVKSEMISRANNVLVSFAFKITDTNFSYNLYYLSAYFEPRCKNSQRKNLFYGNKNRNKTLFDGIAVVIKNPPQEIIYNISNIETKNVKLIKEKLLYINNKTSYYNLCTLDSCSKNEIRKWAVKNILELLMTKSLIEKEISSWFASAS